MTSFRNHRILIASLFLPTTPIFTDSTSSTPDPFPPDSADVHLCLHPPPSPPPPSISALRVGGGSKPPVASCETTPPRKNSTTSSPLESIVDDLKDKSKNVSKTATPASIVPGADKKSNSFFTKLEKDNKDNNSPTSTTLDEAANLIQVQAMEDNGLPLRPKVRMNPSMRTPSRVKRTSRSSSRRPDSSRSLRGRYHQSLYFDYNPLCNGGLKNAVDSVGDKLKKKLWVGTLGTTTDAMGEDMRRYVDQRMLLQDSLPVWIPDVEFEDCYDEFCHQVLWPCLHCAVPDAPKKMFFQESAAYQHYVSVNQRFADTIIANYQPGDLIWVNDYHLMLLPALLRASPHIPANVPIGFFMHVAFPSSEIFRCLPVVVRESLLRGVLATDLVGFQTANFARCFRQSVSRILVLEALPEGIQVEGGGTAGGRFVEVGVFPMGIDVVALKEKRRDPEVLEWVQMLRQRYAGMKIVVGKDKLEEIQGVRQKINAFECFLDKYPDFQQKAVLIQVAIQTTEMNEIAGGVADVVSRLNSRWSTLTYQPVVFLHTQDLTFCQYMALLSVADAFLVTSLREGMALRAHEFVECQEDRHRPLILSEFTGSYSYTGFRSCIGVNPWDKRGTAEAIHKALTMSDEEALSRWKELHSHVITQTAQSFTTTFLNRCLLANTSHLQTDISAIPNLDVTCLLPQYERARRRLMLFDFEGTIWRRGDDDGTGDKALKATFEPPEKPLRLLNKLAEDERNMVWLLSGLEVKGVLEKVGEVAPGVGIVAENGCFIKTRSTQNTPSSWVNMVAGSNMTWKSTCLEILNYFTERTPGSFVEEREASVVWRFWTGAVNDDCPDRQWARRQAAEAQNLIFDGLGEQYGLRIIPGTNSFLVLPNNVSRSTALGAILHPGWPAQSPLPVSAPAHVVEADSLRRSGGSDDDVEFVLAIGNDEKLIRCLNEMEGAETCSVSGRGTDARWKINPDDVVRVLMGFMNSGVCEGTWT